MHLRAPSLVIALLGTACFNPPEVEDTMPGDTEGSTTAMATTSATTSSADETSTGMESVDATDTGECADGCDDDIPCTEDACVDGACVHTPVDDLCGDRIDCTADACDPTLGCVNAPDDALCDDMVPCTQDACDPSMGCTSVPDDAACDDAVGCTVDTCDPTLGCASQPDDALCDDGSGCTDDACDPRLDCQSAGGMVLVLNGSGGASTAPEDAVSALGHTPVVTVDEPSFVAAFDAGGFRAVVFDVPSLFGTVPPAIQTRLDAWVAGGNRLVFGFWSLNADPAMAATLDVLVMSSFDAPLPIHPDPASPADVFGMPEAITPPITYPDYWGDNGDRLVLDGPGFIAGRFDDPVAGPGAILVTHAGHVVTNGFMISEIGAAMVDADADGINDGQELLRNELALVCAAP